jgi:hypothetical protein
MQKSVPVFWSRWIKFLSFFLIVYGLAMVFVPQMMNRTLVGPLLYGNNEVLRSEFVSVGEPEAAFLNVLSGLLGTVTIGWAIQMAWIAHKPFLNSERWAWNSLAMSVCVWAALEFYFKLTDGITGPGLFAHFGLLIAFAIPLLATYRYFHPMALNDTEQEATHEMGGVS